MEHAREIFLEIAEQYETCEEMIDAFRSLQSCGELTEEEYNYINKEWDNMLAEFGL